MIDLIVVPLVAALVILVLHAYLGLHVIEREVIFVDLAFAQIAAMGSTVALLMDAHPGSPLSFAFAFGFTVLGAIIFSFTRLEDSAVPQEAIIGIAYVVASAAVILLAGFTAEGAEHIKETLTGTLIWVSWPAVLRMAGVYAVIGAIHYAFRRPLLAVSFAPERATRIRLWDFFFYITFGIAITFSVAIAGVLMVFSTLVIPAVIAFLYTSRFGLALVIAWLSGAAAIAGGLVVSFVWDVATGPVLVCAFGAALIVAAAVRPLLGVRPPADVVVASLAEETGRAEVPVGGAAR